MNGHNAALESRRTKRRRRNAVAAVEFALIAPVMMIFTFGLVEIGRFMMVKSQAVQATREGARMAIRPNADSGEVVTKVDQTLQLLAINGAGIELEPSDLAAAAPGSFVTVRVRINPSTVSWIPGFLDAAMSDIVSETTMRRESTE